MFSFKRRSFHIIILPLENNFSDQLDTPPHSLVFPYIMANLLINMSLFQVVEIASLP